MTVRKAVIPAAGLGTRFLPASKAIPKEMVTVVDRPGIQYTAEEIVRSGISDICIVISPGKRSLLDHFSPNPQLEAALEAQGKTDLLATVTALNELANVTSVIQEEPLGLGHAVWVARDFTGDEPFVVALPDELFDPAEALIEDLIKTYLEHRKHVVAVLEVPHDQIGLYGAIGAQNTNGELIEVDSVIEKPDPASAPSDLAVIGRYVLEPSVFPILEELGRGAAGAGGAGGVAGAGGAGGEIQLADALGILAGERRLLARRYSGRRWDVGNLAGYLRAVVDLAAEHPVAGPAFRAHLDRR